MPKRPKILIAENTDALRLKEFSEKLREFDSETAKIISSYADDFELEKINISWKNGKIQNN